MRVVCIIQARTGSTRLPRKVLLKLAGKEVLWHVYDRVSRCSLIDNFVVATTTNTADDVLERYCSTRNWDCYRGDEFDVLSRYHAAAQAYSAEIVVRVTSDCPLIDPQILGALVSLFDPGETDYMSTNYPERSFATGLDCEVMTFDALRRAHELATSPYDREHVTPFLYNNPSLFRLAGIRHIPSHAHVRLTIDTPKDYELLKGIFDTFYVDGAVIPTNIARGFAMGAKRAALS